MHRLAIEYIGLLSLWLVCAVLILTAQERWSEAGATKIKEAITRYVSYSHFQFNSIVRSRESDIFCPVLF
jgi:hypothetical protein